MSFDLHLGDCLDTLRKLPDNSVDSVVTDPPYGLSFMGKRWDYDVPSVEVWAECLRVLKPGGHLLAFAGTRTQHRMAVRIEDAGFEIRDMIAWVYGSGFPKSLDVSKAIDQRERGAMVRAKLLHFAQVRGIDGKWLEARGVASAASFADWTTGGHVPSDKNWQIVKVSLGITAEEEAAFEREVIGQRTTGIGTGGGSTPIMGDGNRDITLPATESARQWSGWGTALKPALEPITVARKPLGTCTTNVLQMVESQLRERGVRGEILWKPESASGAVKSKKTTNSGSTAPSERSATSAKTADESVTRSAEQQSLKSSEQLGTSGPNQTQGVSESFQGCTTSDCANPSSLPTEGSAPAAESVSTTFSPLTTSTAAEPSTASKFMGRFTPNCAETDSHQDTESFAGIATVLTGSMETVRINRNSEGFFLWPKGLPEFVPGSPLTVAENVLAHGTGALNIDGCRVATDDKLGGGNNSANVDRSQKHEGWQRPWMKDEDAAARAAERSRESTARSEALGRWPANLIHDGSDEVLAGFPGEADSSAARFFYVPKASKRDRNEGCEHIEARQYSHDGRETPIDNAYQRNSSSSSNSHPTVKPTDLMAYLCRLVTPPGGTVLDPFMGSGSTGKAAMREGFRFIGCELSPEYMEIARARIAHALWGDLA